MAPECKEQDGGHEASDSRDVAASAVSCSHPQRLQKDQEAQLHFNANRTKSRVKSSSRRLFLDSSLSDEEEEEEEEAGGVENAVVGGVLSTFIEKSWGAQEPQGAENGGAERLVDQSQDCSLSPQSKLSENSWTCPLMSDELSPSASEAEPEEACGQSSGPAKPQVRAKSCSGMILKLRRMFSEGLNRKKSRYQAVSESGTFADPSFSQADGAEGGSTERERHRRTPKVTHRWQRTGSFCHALRPLSSSSKRKSLLKIKYCPYLSACHSAEHRRRWVLRSAVQRARRAMRFYYPDLVGKTIHHLYEEDDKSEVWYRGEVLRIHEAHTNPLKTIFEVRYDSEPEWKYYLELLIDYKKGWLKIED